ncbi:MAG: DUF3794 domain-containing protein [Clostridiales bacterium]|nr:DUF3794 domain-containing protein [Clostridiales bacterium]
MELVKKNIHMNKLKCKSDLQITLDDDFNVPDVKPDIYKIIKEQGEVRIHDLKISNGKILVQGALVFNVLYLSDESDRPIYNISSQIPIEEVIHLDGVEVGDDASISVEIEDLSSSLINSRKFNIKSIVTITVFIDELYDEATAVSVALDDSVEYITTELTVTNIAINKRDTYRFKDEIHLPSNKGNIQEVLYSEVELRNPEARLLEDKFTIKGEILVFILYAGENEETPIEYYESELPFSSTIDLNGCRDDMIDDISFELGSKSIQVLADDDGEDRILDVEVVIDMGIKVYQDENLELLYDLYSTSKDIKPVWKETYFENLLVKNNSKARLNDRVKINKNQPSILQICHGVGKAKIDDVFIVEDGLEVNGVIEVQIMYISSDDQIPLNTIKSMIPFTQLVEVRDIKEDIIYDVNARLEQLSVMMLDSEEIEVKAGIAINTIAFDKINTRVISDVEVAKLDKKEVQSMPSVVGYIVKPNETLWDIAKKFRTTRLDLIELNRLEDENVRSGDKILITKHMEQLI